MRDHVVLDSGSRAEGGNKSDLTEAVGDPLHDSTDQDYSIIGNEGGERLREEVFPPCGGVGV